MSKEEEFPRNFSWLEPGKLAGCARPESEQELKAAKGSGVAAIVSLTGTPLNPEAVGRLGFDYLHSHISSVPTLEQLDKIIQFIEEENQRSRPVLVHCGEGRGRTGTVLAAYLVSHGMSAENAIRKVREKRPGSIESVEQENVIREFEKFRARK